MTNDLGERRDLVDERDSEEYQAMCDTVREEWTVPNSPFPPYEYCVHAEAMRRLKAKYENACGK